ncbi:hypothetical protein GPA10_24840 [Streptomyces sp. p1417]|uniref:Uncharacterized protein n=1 Tax=Streptomyces typhae TaxID=2681492 RepID=A0A6L6X246_9ACTN|nr:hypothetical protein [Streptomyces typhae]MVO87895.1 hypothetical protein [Streptomyces typhae]
MNEHTTQPARSIPPLSEQRPAVEALATLVEMFGSLPGGYITIHTRPFGGPVRLELQFDSPQDFEQWRTCLRIAPADVVLVASPGYTWLSAVGRCRGVDVEITGFGVPLTYKQATTQQVAGVTA